MICNWKEDRVKSFDQLEPRCTYLIILTNHDVVRIEQVGRILVGHVVLAVQRFLLSATLAVNLLVLLLR